MAHQILLVDDDPTQRRLMQEVVESRGFRTLQASSGEEALDIVLGDKGAGVSLVLLDLVMPDTDGIAVLEKVRPVRPELPVIVLTAKGGVETVVNAMRAGADDFIVKPARPERIEVSIRNALKVTALTHEITRLNKRAKGELTFDDLIANSAPMRQAINLGKRAAQSNIPILILGESGAGKELIARAIQGASERAGKPFVTVNCGAIPDNLVESILFGHEKGAFTGATDKHMGKFQEANGGTLFLDEIGELRLDMQVRLLRALQEGEVDPVGARKPVKVDIRLISATNRDLQAMVAQGDFREDLYYRLNVFPIEVAPLRDRREDIRDLAELFIRRFSVEEGKKIAGLDEAAIRLLTAYDWPGNVRQLENAVFRAVVLSDGDRLGVADFPQIAQAMGMVLTVGGVLDAIPDAPPKRPETEEEASESGSLQKRPPETPPSVMPRQADPREEAPGSGIPVFDAQGHLRRLEDIENELIRLAIDRYSGHMSEVARRLGIGRSTLYRKVRDMGLERPEREAG